LLAFIAAKVSIQVDQGHLADTDRIGQFQAAGDGAVVGEFINQGECLVDYEITSRVEQFFHLLVIEAISTVIEAFAAVIKQ